MSEGIGENTRELELRIEELVRRVEAMEEKVIRGSCYTVCIAVCVCCGIPQCVKGVRIELEHLPGAAGGEIGAS